jgi:hypothetical protein
MAFESGRRGVDSSSQVDDEVWPGPLDTVEERDLPAEDIPLPESPHIVRLEQSRGGPYYVAPDSAEPLPSGMWSELDPDEVEGAVSCLQEIVGDNNSIVGPLPDHLREELQSGGPAARRLLEALDHTS